MSRLLNPEEAVVTLVRYMGYNKNPIGAFREVLFRLDAEVDFDELAKLELIKKLDKSGNLGYYSAWIELSLKAKNLYNKVEINYRWKG